MTSGSDDSADQPIKKRPRPRKAIEDSSDEDAPIATKAAPTPKLSSQAAAKKSDRMAVDGEDSSSSSSETDPLFKGSDDDDDSPPGSAQKSVQQSTLEAQKRALDAAMERSSSPDTPLANGLPFGSVSAPTPISQPAPSGGRYNPAKQAKVKLIGIPIPKKKSTITSQPPTPSTSAFVPPAEPGGGQDRFPSPQIVDSPQAMSPAPPPTSATVFRYVFSSLITLFYFLPSQSPHTSIGGRAPWRSLKRWPVLRSLRYRRASRTSRSEY